VRYELAKQLDEAGFPQGGKGDWLSDPDALIARDRVYAPTLEELIEACGAQFEELQQTHTPNESGDTWLAGCSQNAHRSRGEALARTAKSERLRTTDCRRTLNVGRTKKSVLLSGAISCAPNDGSDHSFGPFLTSSGCQASILTRKRHPRVYRAAANLRKGPKAPNPASPALPLRSWSLM